MPIFLQWPVSPEARVHDLSRARVLFINNNVSLYGAENSLFELVCNLERFIPVVLLPEGGSLGDRLADRNVQVLIRDFRKQEADRDSMMEALITEHRIRLVHVNKTFKDYFGFVVTLRAVTRRLNIPMIMHVRGRVEYRQEQQALLAAMESAVFVSQQTYREHMALNGARSGGARLANTSVIYNGRSLAPFEFSEVRRKRVRDELGFDHRDYVLGMIGRIVPDKGQDQLLRLACRMRGRRCVKFVVAGDPGSAAGNGFIDGLMAIRQDYGLQRGVLFLGYRQCSDIISALDVLLSFSTTEGLPGVIIEAMAAGRVIVAHAVGGIPEMLGCDEAGFTVTPGDLESIESLVHALQSGDVSGAAVGRRAAARAQRLFSVRRHVAEIEALYSSLLSRPSAHFVAQ